MKDSFAIFISSCDSFSDLWNEQIRLLKKNWCGELPPIYLVTDKETSYKDSDIRILIFDGEMPFRLKKAMEIVEEKYILLTLDDYFLINEAKEDNFRFFINFMINNSADYLLLYDRRYTKKRYYKRIDCIKSIDLNEKYAVNLYPAIWNKSFFIKCVRDGESPWEFEPKLTKRAIENNANCFSNISGSYNILDVVRKGKVLHKANRYFKKNGIDIGDRAIIERREEFILFLKDFARFHLPKPIAKLTKKIALRMGMKFYSDD